MIRSRADRIADPLRDYFTVEELPRISPWSAEQIRAIGPEVFRQSALALGVNPARPQRVSTWVSVISLARGENWEELDVA